MHYIETAIVFVLVLLAGSLMVNIVVRMVHAATGERARGVQDMLGQLHRGFCEHRRIRPESYPATQRAFLDAVLASPILHDSRTMTAAEAEVDQARAKAERRRRRSHAERSAAAAERHHLAADGLVRAGEARRQRRLWGRIEHISRDDVLAIVRACAHPDGTLPPEWFGDAPATRPPPTRLQERILQLQVVSPEIEPGTEMPAAFWISARDFHDYCRRWFGTAEATVTERFGAAARRVSLSVSALLVVALNLDALRLAYDLYHDRVHADRVVGRAGDLDDVAERQVAPAGGPDLAADPPIDPAQLQVDLEKTAATLTGERVPLGWQDAWIVKRWCAFHDACASPDVPKPTRAELALDLLMWVLGLAASWALLSLGAPFWVGMLKRVTGLANVLAGKGARAIDPHRTEAEAWERDVDGQVPSWWIEASGTEAAPRKPPGEPES